MTEAQDTELLKASEPMKFKTQAQYGDHSDETISGAVKTVKILGEKPFSSVKQKRYAYAPLGDKDMELLKHSRSIDDYTAVLAALPTANCNTATTQYVAAQLAKVPNPRLNVVSGYLNDGDNKLTDHEAHMFAVDETGDILDPTPSTMAEPEQKGFGLNGQLPINVFDPKNVAIGLGAAGLFTALRRRRDIKDRANVAYSKWAVRRYHKMITSSDHRLTPIANTLARAIYAQGKSSKYSPQYELGTLLRSQLPELSWSHTKQILAANNIRPDLKQKYLLWKISHATQGRNGVKVS